MPTFDESKPYEEVAVADAPKFNPDQPFEPVSEGEQWKPLYSGLDQAPMNPEHAQALDYLGRKLGDDKETRAAAINQSYVQSKMPDWSKNVMQQNWSTIRDQYAKEAGFTQGEPITDSGLYTKIAADIAEEPQRNKIIGEITPYSGNNTDRLHYQTMNLPQLTTWQELNAPNTFAELAGKKLELGSLPDIPGLGLGNPALGAAAWNTIVRILPSLTSPLSVATIGVGAEASAGSEVAQKALTGISGLFAGLMAWAAGSKVPEIIDTMKDPKAGTQEKGEAVGGAITDMALSLMAGLHAVSAFAPEVAKKVEGQTTEQAAQTMRQEANATTEPSAREAMIDVAAKFDDIPSSAIDYISHPEKWREAKRREILLEIEDSAQNALAENKQAMRQGDQSGPETLPAEQNVTTAKETVSPQDVDKAFSAKNKAVDATLKSMGEEPATRGDKLTFEQALKDAKEKMSADPEAGMKLVDELSGNPRPVTGNEDALLHMEVTRLSLEREAARKAFDEATKAGDQAAIADAQERITRAQEDYRNTVDVTSQVGTANAHGLAFRAMMLKEDYSLASMERQKAEATGKSLTPDQTAEIQELHDRIAKTQKAFDEYRARASELLMAEDEAARPKRGKPPSKIAAKLAEQADAARERIKQRLTSGRVSSGLDPQDLADHAIIGADYIAKGLRKFADWSEAMIKEFGDKILPHLKDIYDHATAYDSESKHGEFLDRQKKQLTESIIRLEKKIKERELSPQDKTANRPAVEELEALRQKKDALSDELTRMREQAAKIKELEEAIAEKTKKISEGDLAPNGMNQSRPATKEIENLKQQRDQLNKDLGEARKQANKPTDAEVLEKRLAAMKEDIVEKETKLASGNINPEAEAMNRPLPRELEQAKQRLEQLNKEIAEARKGPPKDPRETLLKAFKTRTAKSTEQLKEKTAQGDFSPRTRQPLRLDEEGLRLKAEHERAKQEFQRALLKDKLAKEGLAGKAASALIKWRRGFLLSSPVTLAKLSGAAALRMASTPIEEAIGAGLGKIPGFSTIAENAPREGGMDFSAEGHALVDAVTKGIEDAANIFKTGKSNLEAAVSKQAGEVHISDIAPPSVIDFFGHVHAALKAPVKRAEFARSFEKRMAFAESHGVDITDPLVQTRITTEAYKDANRAIFMQDNMVVDAYKRALSRFEQINKDTGKPESLVGSTLLRLALPIVKVPTNIVAETATYATGTLAGTAKTIHAALTKGLDNLSPEQSDLILRQLKKGLMGNALLLLGYFNADKFGGYYQQGQKRKKDDVAVGGAKIGDTEVPSYVLHNPAMEQLQIGATIHRVADSKLNKHDREQQGLASGAWAAGLGLIEGVPFAREAVEVSKLFDPHERTYAGGELLKSIFVPAVVQWAATQMDRDSSGDKIKRDPKTIGQHIEAGIPGLRKDVPKKK